MTDRSKDNLSFKDEPLPESEAEVRARHEANRAGWNEGAQYYRANLEQSIQTLREGITNLHPVERVNLGEHPDSYWENFPNLLPEHQTHIPMTFSVLVRRLEDEIGKAQ